MIDTATKTLLPWRTRLWDDNLARLGGVTRIYAGDVSPDDSLLRREQRLRRRRPPISDTAIRFPIAGADNVQPDCGSPGTSTASTRSPSPRTRSTSAATSSSSRRRPRRPRGPVSTNVGYGTGQGLSGYGLGDDVVRRDHLGAVDPATGHALEWNPGSNSFEGNKAMLATPRGLFAGGDAGIQGGKSVGRIAFFDFNNDPNPPTAIDTTITTPIEGRVEAGGVPFTHHRHGHRPLRRAAGPGRDPGPQHQALAGSRRSHLADPGDQRLATLTTPNATSTTWSLTSDAHRDDRVLRLRQDVRHHRQRRLEGGQEDRVVRPRPTRRRRPNITGPSGSLIAVDDLHDDRHRDRRPRHQPPVATGSGTRTTTTCRTTARVGPIFNTFRGTPDVIGAPNATWSYDVTLPHEGTWRGSATADRRRPVSPTCAAASVTGSSAPRRSRRP